MKQEDNELLLVDLCARLPYGIKMQLKNTYRNHCDKMCNIDEIKSIDKKGEHIKIYHNNHLDYEWYIDDIEIEDIKPYLRSMSSMTEEEKGELGKYMTPMPDNHGKVVVDVYLKYIDEVVDYLNKKMLDWRGLIKKGLALEAPGNMYK